eukprot:TRINITY_DN29806_c0_g1_i2.p1 TRINITY_DN29806_c0_g1~~TRINITY_DN29806_c0_g1_i2.p1  ORF type:complete len:208 (-),score=9.10 TRINITY_DN29806_c0_g1_i2:307-930(-)
MVVHSFTKHASTLRATPQRAHQHCRCRCRAVKEPAIQELKSLCESTARGVSSTPSDKSRILEIVKQLKETQVGTCTTDERLNAQWKLLWTTEKETLFILQRAPFFGTRAGDSFQVINTDEGWLQNVITFPPHGAFLVDSSISREGNQRVNFKFEAAALRTEWRKWPIPPYGAGWFDTVYIDDSIRIAEDSRGDTLIVSRDGDPVKFK